jgi:hypothetical protein
MTATSDEARGCCVGLADVLTVHEESALSSIRGIVAEIRSKDRAVTVEDVEKALISVGGTVSSDAEGRGSRTYDFCGARMSLSADSGSGGTIQLSFIPAVR